MPPQLEPGTHVAVHRRGRGYDHHGIVLANGCVFKIQRGTDGIEVRDISLEQFADGSPTRVVAHGRSGIEGIFAPVDADSPHLVLGRVETLRLACARGLLGGYDLLDRNCEHLANWCVTGDLDSVQVRKLWFGGGGLISLAGLSYVSAVSRGLVKRPAPLLLALVGAYSFVRIAHTTVIHRRTWKLSVALADLDRERGSSLT